MSFIRPTALKFLRSYAEVFAGLILAGIGVYNIMLTGWVLKILGAAALLAGLAISFTALRRARFPVASEGPGVVEVDERQISYFSAFEGGAVSVEALALITIYVAQSPLSVVWCLEEDSGAVLKIPATAAGIEGLFDAFAPLTGVDYDAISAASKGERTGIVAIWSKDRARVH